MQVDCGSKHPPKLPGERQHASAQWVLHRFVHVPQRRFAEHSNWCPQSSNSGWNWTVRKSEVFLSTTAKTGVKLCLTSGHEAPARCPRKLAKIPLDGYLICGADENNILASFWYNLALPTRFIISRRMISLTYCYVSYYFRDAEPCLCIVFAICMTTNVYQWDLRLSMSSVSGLRTSVHVRSIVEMHGNVRGSAFQ